MKKLLLLIVITAFAIGAFLRVWQLRGVPISLFGDELDVGLQANSILTTGKDYFGNKFPVMFHSFAEYRLPMQPYLAAPFIKVFGLNELGARGPAVLMGFLSILSFYLLAKELFGKKAAVISCLFLLFSPWHFNFSRQANDAGILLPFVIFGTYFFLKGRKDFRYLIVSTILFSLSIYAYAISSVFVPLLVIGLTVLFRREIFAHGIKKLGLIGILCLLILSPYLNWTLKGRTTKRISDISAIPMVEVVAEVENARKLSGGIPGKLFYNKATVIVARLFENYTQAFSPAFLFARGDPNTRNSVDEFGQMYHLDALFVLLGLSLVIYGLMAKKGHKRELWLIVLWLVLAPIPAALTKGGGTHASRLILMLPPLILLSSLGFGSLMGIKKLLVRRAVLLVTILIMIFEVARFMNHYFVVWPVKNWKLWQYGFKETLEFVQTQDKNYQKVFLNSTYEPMLPRFLFYYRYDMAAFQREFEKDTFDKEIVPGMDGFKLGEKYYFGDLKKPIENLADPNILVVASAEKDATNPEIFNNRGLNLIKTTYAPDGTPIFYVFFGAPKK